MRIASLSSRKRRINYRYAAMNEILSLTVAKALFDLPSPRMAEGVSKVRHTTKSAVSEEEPASVSSRSDGGALSTTTAIFEERVVVDRSEEEKRKDRATLGKQSSEEEEEGRVTLGEQINAEEEASHGVVACISRREKQHLERIEQARARRDKAFAEYEAALKAAQQDKVISPSIGTMESPPVKRSRSVRASKVSALSTAKASRNPVLERVPDIRSVSIPTTETLRPSPADKKSFVFHAAWNLANVPTPLLRRFDEAWASPRAEEGRSTNFDQAWTSPRAEERATFDEAWTSPQIEERTTFDEAWTSPQIEERTTFDEAWKSPKVMERTTLDNIRLGPIAEEGASNVNIEDASQIMETPRRATTIGREKSAVSIVTTLTDEGDRETREQCHDGGRSSPRRAVVDSPKLSRGPVGEEKEEEDAFGDDEVVQALQRMISQYEAALGV
eukprot:g774.t1